MDDKDLAGFYQFWQTIENGANDPVVRPFLALEHGSSGGSQINVTNIGGRISVPGLDVFVFNSDKCKKLPDAHVRNVLDKIVDRLKEHDSPSKSSITEDCLMFLLGIKPSCNYKVYQEYAVKFSSIYESDTSCKIKDNLKLSKAVSFVFNITRLHASVLNRDFSKSEQLLLSITDNFHNDFYIELLYQSFLFYLVWNQNEKAIQTFKSIWLYCNSLDNKQRFNENTWDVFVISMLLIWFVAKFDSNFKTLATTELDVDNYALITGKKVSLINALSPMQIQQILPEPYYDLICEINKNLPK